MLTTRDPAFNDERNRRSLSAFVEMRRAWLKARQGTEKDMHQFQKRYPHWKDLAPNRFASHFFCLRTAIYIAA